MVEFYQQIQQIVNSQSCGSIWYTNSEAVTWYDITIFFSGEPLRPWHYRQDFDDRLVGLEVSELLGCDEASRCHSELVGKSTGKLWKIPKSSQIYGPPWFFQDKHLGLWDMISKMLIKWDDGMIIIGSLDGCSRVTPNVGWSQWDWNGKANHIWSIQYQQ
jgi:hypothetical protein